MKSFSISARLSSVSLPPTGSVSTRRVRAASPSTSSLSRSGLKVHVLRLLVLRPGPALRLGVVVHAPSRSAAPAPRPSAAARRPGSTSQRAGGFGLHRRQQHLGDLLLAGGQRRLAHQVVDRLARLVQHLRLRLEQLFLQGEVHLLQAGLHLLQGVHRLIDDDARPAPPPSACRRVGHRGSGSCPSSPGRYTSLSAFTSIFRSSAGWT